VNSYENPTSSPENSPSVHLTHQTNPDKTANSLSPLTLSHTTEENDLQSSNHQTEINKLTNDLEKTNTDLYKQIAIAKNKCFQEYATGLSHLDRSRNVYKAIKTIGINQPHVSQSLL
jgi:hypothetical protein